MFGSITPKMAYIFLTFIFDGSITFNPSIFLFCKILDLSTNEITFQVFFIKLMCLIKFKVSLPADPVEKNINTFHFN